MRLREVIVDPDSWPAPPASKPGEPDNAKEIAEFKKKYGLK